MSHDISWVTIMLAIAAPTFGFVGVMVGQLGSRGREMREMRRRAYVDWLVMLQDLPASEGFMSTEPKLVEAIQKLNAMTTEIAIVGSRRVMEAAQNTVDLILADEYAETLGAAAAKDPVEILLAHQKAIRPGRRQVVIAMRRDLHPWWALWSRRTLLLSSEPDASLDASREQTT